MKSLLFVFSVLAVLRPELGAAQPKEQMNTIDSLREAIVFLSETYGDQYSNGPEYLRRLNLITDTSSDTYKQLQREALLDHPYVRTYEWLIEVHNPYWGNHGPMNTVFQNGDFNTWDRGGLKEWLSYGSRFDVIRIGARGQVTRIRQMVEQAEGIVRDADISFDGQKIMFSMRRNKADDYHIYEMNVDGTNLRQLTFGSEIGDVDPIYLPSGKILFSSTRDPKMCQCNRHISLNVFTAEADGANILQVSGNGLSDFHSSLMPDGTVMYSRWEYVDRHFGPSLGLWTSNPDGTRHKLFMGNNSWVPGSMVDARAIPGTDKVICIYGACHDLPWGAMVVVDRSQGMEGPDPVVHMWPDEGRQYLNDDPAYNRSLKDRWHVDLMGKVEERYEDPFPVHDVLAGDGDGSFFMVSKALGNATRSYTRGKKHDDTQVAIVLADVFGNEVVVYAMEDPLLGAYGAIPLSARKKPPVIPDTVDYTKDHGYLYVNDVYLGTGDEMQNVARGSIKYLRIIDAPARRTFDERDVWNVDAAQVTAMNWNLTNNKRILGDVPVEKDGSAFFKIPADTFVQIHALDEDKQMIQAMRTGTIVRPGETQGCIGCHEDRVSAPQATNLVPLATRRGPSELQPWLDTPSVEAAEPFNYLTQVQPVFDQNCVSCHDYGKEAGDVLNLAGDLSYPFNVSYTELMSKSGFRYTGPEEKLVNFVGDGPPGVLPAYAWGSHRSKLVRVLKEGHYDVELSDEEMQRITTWIDVNAVYYGRYSSYYPGRNPMRLVGGDLHSGWQAHVAVMGEELAHSSKYRDEVEKVGHLVNFTRPELSPILQRFEDADARAQALAYIHEAAELLAERPREDQINRERMDSVHDEHYLGRFQRTQEEKAKTVKAVVEGKKHYQYQ
ncbi:hypothetical protein Caka_3040 [Coraliomargarita akajimensis DSM 45221]|uniref:Cytochrome c domain-containing protein n=2 Tax=Coraliomargarita TaxID=442430 RepID=D5EI13_CORAD|nr:hypothetical protein Caka_3040 [Coraliomargarita akajimensis DSM 45221]